MDVKAIRENFPHPVKADTAHELGAYCVGGAICQMANMSRWFPGKWTLAQALVILNPSLSFPDALYFSESIVDLNDLENFEGAWSIAKSALEMT